VERGPGGGLEGVGAGGLWRCKGWETLGSQTPTKTGGRRVGQTASGAWAGTAHNKAKSKDSGDINALTVLPGAVCGCQRGRAARPKVLKPWNDD